MRKLFEDVGLPPGHAFPKLSYHVPTCSVVVFTCPQKGELPCKRLSIRSANEPQYAELIDLPRHISIESFALSCSLPLLFFITNTVERHEKRGILSTLGLPHQELEREPVCYAANWDALYRYDIRTRKHEVIARNGELHADGDFSRLWLNEVLAVSDDAHVLYVKSAMECGTSVDYHISSLNLSGLWLQPITKLEATFA